MMTPEAMEAVRNSDYILKFKEVLDREVDAITGLSVFSAGARDRDKTMSWAAMAGTVAGAIANTDYQNEWARGMTSPPERRVPLPKIEKPRLELTEAPATPQPIPIRQLDL